VNPYNGFSLTKEDRFRKLSPKEERVGYRRSKRRYIRANGLYEEWQRFWACEKARPCWGAFYPAANGSRDEFYIHLCGVMTTIGEKIT